MPNASNLVLIRDMYERFCCQGQVTRDLSNALRIYCGSEKKCAVREYPR